MSLAAPGTRIRGNETYAVAMGSDVRSAAYARLIVRVRGLEVRFEAGRAVEVRADDGEDLMKAQVAADNGAARLGEVALVDGHSRVGKTGLVFYDTLFDENASSHIALGAAITHCIQGASEVTPEERHARGVNHSSIHTDFMIGSPELVISGVTVSGDEVPILRNGDWVL